MADVEQPNQDRPMTDINRFWRELIAYIHEEIVPAWNKAMEATRESFEEIAEAMEEYQECEKQRVSQELITPPLDHTMSHVTHTGTKPPHPARIYRRRTP